MVEKEKIIITWSFDEMSSSTIMADYDKNKNKILDKDEIIFMENDRFKGFSEFNFFMIMVENGKEIPLKKYDKFDASFEKGRMTYIFEIQKPKSKTYEMHFFDPEMYVALILNKKDIKCYSGSSCKVEGYDADFYYAYKVTVKE